MYWQALKSGIPDARSELQAAFAKKMLAPPGAALDSPWYTERYEAQFATQKDRHAIVARIYPEEVPELAPVLYRIIPHTLSISFIQFFVTKPHSNGPIHIDGNTRYCALNFPVFGADKGQMEWFADAAFDREYVNNQRVAALVPGASTQLWKALPRGSLPKPVAYLTLNTPCLVNSGEWHRVNNSVNPEYRLVASVRFDGNPSFEEAACLLGLESPIT